MGSLARLVVRALALIGGNVNSGNVLGVILFVNKTTVTMKGQDFCIS